MGIVHAFIAMCRAADVMEAPALCDASGPELACCAIELPGNAHEARSIMVLPDGRAAARDGRWWKVDAAAVAAATAERAGPIRVVIDYDHQTQYTRENGGGAPASGWLTGFVARDGGVWADVEWTAKAAAAIEAKEYRYISPAFTREHDAGGNARAIVSVALTNSPALDLPALASSTGGSQVEEFLKQILAALGLADDAGEEAALAAVRLAAGRSKELADAAKAAGLEPVATASALVEKVRGANVDPGEFVPRSEFQALATTLKKLQDDAADTAATDAVGKAIGAGKITPAQRDWALSYAKDKPEDFAAYCAAAPVIVTPGARTAPGGAPDADAPLTADEIAVCETLGISQEKFREKRKEMAT